MSNRETNDLKGELNEEDSNPMAESKGLIDFRDTFSKAVDKRALLGPSNSVIAVMEKKDENDPNRLTTAENSMAISMRLERDMFGKTLVCGALRQICNNLGKAHKCDEFLCANDRPESGAL